MVPAESLASAISIPRLPLASPCLMQRICFLVRTATLPPRHGRRQNCQSRSVTTGSMSEEGTGKKGKHQLSQLCVLFLGVGPPNGGVFWWFPFKTKRKGYQLKKKQAQLGKCGCKAPVAVGCYLSYMIYNFYIYTTWYRQKLSCLKEFQVSPLRDPF